MRKINLVAVTFFLVLLSATILSARQHQKPAQSTTDPIAKVVGSGVNSIHLPGTQGGPGLERRYPRYQLTDGDVLAVDFPFTPEFDQTVTVQPDGYVSLKDVGDVHIAGETVPQVRSQFQKSYSKILRNPAISVDLKNFESPYFLALGQVGHPGKYDLRGVTTVAAAVSMAGGLTQEAKESQVLLFRRVSEDWVSVTKVNLKKMLSSKSLTEDPQLHPGDMIYVPSSAISKVSRFIPFPTLSSALYRTPIP